MKNKFGFYCYLNNYDNEFPTLYHFEPDIYTYEEIHSGKYPRICFTYLDIFNFNRWHIDNGNSILEWDDCKIDETTNTFVDIGANSGFASYYAYLKGAKNIFSFEPSIFENRSFLMNNIPNTTLYSMALSDTVGFKEVSTIWDKTNTRPVFCVTLDYLFEQNLFSNIDFLKIDVEGHEYQVLKGLSDDNLKKVKNISLELHGSNRKDDPTMGKIFIDNLQHRLWNIPYFDGETNRKRYTFLLYRGGEDSIDSYLYSKII